MSERRNLENLLRAASFDIQRAVSQLNEAQDYLERHDFLQDANPLLGMANKAAIRQLSELQIALWDVEVQS